MVGELPPKCSSRRPIVTSNLWANYALYQLRPVTEQLGIGTRYLGLAILALAVGTSSLTFNWVIEHRAESNFFPEFAGRVVYLSDILLLVGLIFWTTGWYLSPRQRLRYGPWYVFLPLLGLFVLTVLSIVWADDGTQAGFIALRRFGLLALYIAMVNDSARAMVPVVVALFVIGFLHATVALAQVVGESAVGMSLLGELTEGAFGYGAIGDPRAYGLGFNPNPVGLFLAVVSALSYSMYLLSPGGWQDRALTLLPFITTFAGLGTTGSRSASLGWLLAVSAVTTLAWLGTEDRRAILRRVVIALLLVIAVGTVLLFFAYKQPSRDNLASSGIGRVLEIFVSDSISDGVASRTKDWELSFPIIRGNLIWGVGAGNYPLALKERLSPSTFDGIWTPIHNVPLTATAELGLIGGVSWALIMAAPLLWFLSSRTRSPGRSAPQLWLYQSQGGTYMDSHTSPCGVHLGISDHESVLHHHR
jgi:hypothetical protein